MFLNTAFPLQYATGVQRNQTKETLKQAWTFPTKMGLLRYPLSADGIQTKMGLLRYPLSADGIQTKFAPLENPQTSLDIF